MQVGQGIRYELKVSNPFCIWSSFCMAMIFIFLKIFFKIFFYVFLIFSSSSHLWSKMELVATLLSLHNRHLSLSML